MRAAARHSASTESNCRRVTVPSWEEAVPPKNSPSSSAWTPWLRAARSSTDSVVTGTCHRAARSRRVLAVARAGRVMALSFSPVARVRKTPRLRRSKASSTRYSAPVKSEKPSM